MSEHTSARGLALMRDIVLLLMVKVALLAGIYMAFFSPAHRSSDTSASHIFDAGPAGPTERKH
jgi:hypothetical protein